jgi:E3 ubiquitin-protein ligase RNF14
MEDDPGAADDERIIELSSIAAIFPELVLSPQSPYDATLSIAVSPSPPLKIRFHQSAESGPPLLPTPPTSIEADEDPNAANGTKRKAVQSTEGAAEDVHQLAHLPPLVLHIHLPEGYPPTKPPVFELSTSPPWIPKTTLEEMEADGMRLWQELGRDQVVFTYIDHLQQLAENGFNLAGHLQDDVNLSSDMKLGLLDFDLKTKRELFEKETFDCGVCLEPKKGVHCHRLLLCSHVFCVPCLQDFYNNCINEGDVDNVKCLAPNCGKEIGQGPVGDGQTTPASVSKRKKVDRSLSPSELLQIPIEQELVQRYVRLKRKKRLESDKSTIYCPRQWCQGAARSSKHPKPIDPLNDPGEATSGSEGEDAAEAAKKQPKKSRPEDVPMAERLCICEDCNFAFCSVCKKGWHGELAVCNPRRQHELNEEEKASLEYLKLHTTACPTCSAPAQKTVGCNHMICFKCNTHFCYLCSAYLMPDNPYRHFNDPKSTCHMRLWELENGDGDQAGNGIGYAGGGNWEDEDSDDDSSNFWDSDDDDDDGDDDDDDDDGDDNFEDFGGDGDFIHFSDEEDDSSDEEPVPDQRPAQGRDMRIEIVNFARAGGAANPRIFRNIPPAAPAAPPPAPIPPRRPRRGRRDVRQPVQGRQQPPAGLANLPRNPGFAHGHRDLRAQIREAVRDHFEEHDAADVEHEEVIRAGPAPGQGRGAAQQPAPLRAMGLERFLELAQRDQEDEWDSDELNE